MFEFSFAVQSLPFEYQLLLCQRPCEMARKMFQTNVRGILKLVCEFCLLLKKQSSVFQSLKVV
ncbi:unnamed protein product [Clavelina lepadiformis]|uniref:Uncharacterized protein n=1 Tax=Clavelina lepadiformis TaxID=159417 RepID=A0ABP0GGD0_CLALP